MNFINKLSSIFIAEIQDRPDWSNFQNVLVKLFDSMWLPFVAVFGSVVVVWGTIIGIKFAQAGEDEQKRKEAKKEVAHFFKGIGLIFLIAGCMPIIIAVFNTWLGKK